MGEWKKYSFSDFLIRVKEPITIENSETYKRVTIRTKHGGVSLRDIEIGSKIGTKKQFVLRSGQFVLSKIDARYGAFGIAPEEVDEAIITGNFWAYDVDEEIISIQWLNHFTNSASFYDLCERASSGITHRKYLNEKIFLDNEIWLPNIDKQAEIVAQVEHRNKGLTSLTTELTHQQSLLKKLRQAILQEAIEGKLTAEWRAQNPTVEPAADLLTRIRAEKAQLVKAKKIRKQKPLPPIKPEEIPFALPEGWVWCRLGELILMHYGKGLPKAQTHRTGKYAVYGSNGIVGFYDKGLTDKRSVIIGRKGSAGAIQVAYTGSWTTDVAYFIEESENIDFDYMAFILKSQKLEELGKGIKPGLNRGEAYSLLTPLAPLAEQKAIVAKVERLLATVDQLQGQNAAAQEQAGQLMQAVLKEAFQQNGQ